MSLIAGVLGRAGQRGQQRRITAAQEGVVTWDTPAEILRHLKKLKAAEKGRLEKEGKGEFSGREEATEADFRDQVTDTALRDRFGPSSNFS